MWACVWAYVGVCVHVKVYVGVYVGVHKLTWSAYLSLRQEMTWPSSSLSSLALFRMFWQNLGMSALQAFLNTGFSR